MKKTVRKYLSVFLAVAMLVTTLLPMGAYAAKSMAAYTAESVTGIASYSTFIEKLKILDRYAVAYAQEHNADATLLEITYIRTGVEKYNDDQWEMLAGKANTDFIEYVAQEDAKNGTDAALLRNLANFTLPNGQEVDFRHMFATLNIAYFKNNEDTADFGGWIGDICDLMEYSHIKGIKSTELETLVAEIKAKYFGIDDDEYHTFGILDLRGDLDAYYLYRTLKADGGNLSTVLENYFTEVLTDEDRAAFFINNRIPGNTTKEKVRGAVTEKYVGNALVKALEANRKLSDLENIELLRKACCYVFADWCYENGKDKLTEVDPDNPDPEPGDEAYYSVFSSNTTTIAPGVSQTVNYALTRDDKQIVYYIATADLSRDDVDIYANYHANDPSQGWAMSRVTDQMAAAQKKHSNPSDTANYVEHYNAVVGVNADFYDMTNGVPNGALVMEGKEYHGGGSNFFAIMKNGTAMIGSASEYGIYKDQIQEAVGGGIYLVKDGKSVVSSTSDYYNNRHSRTCVGITASGKVVLMVLDGRQQPFSAGGSAEELAQIMLDAGCVTAINLDGGGSTTFVAKQEGSNELTIVNRPSDGYERSVSSSLMIVSTAPASNEFDHALVTSDYDYLTIGTSIKFTATGVSSSGNSANLPSNVVWESSDEAIGTISEGGVFTAKDNGTVEIRLMSNGTEIGSKTIEVVNPDGLKFTKKSINTVYGKPISLPLVATYNENPVAICADDIEFELSNDAAGEINATGSEFLFIGNEDSGLKNTTVVARISYDYSIEASVKIAMYSENQTVFDFDNCTGGDRSLAWIRDVSNAELVFHSKDEPDRYHVINTNKPMDVDYVFALDMTTIDVPDNLRPLLSMVAGGDVTDVTAWDFLLQLAERVSPKTEVTIKIQFDRNFHVDTSNLAVSNDYFCLTNAVLDDNNLLTVTCNFVKQSQAIDPDIANPICILSGIKITPVDSAAWDANNRLNAVISGSVGYDIYLGANALYNMSTQTSFQEQYGIYPYEEPENVTHPKGGHFYCKEYKTFNDRFALDNGAWSGWKTENGVSYYFVDNEMLKGIHKVPGQNDAENEYYYHFDETTGASLGKFTGLFETNGDRYYAINGVLKSGWRELTDENGENSYYYFDENTFKGLNGKTQRFYANVTYEFDKGRLLSGVWVMSDHGKRYYYGPGFVQGKWYTIEGNLYFFDQEGYRYEGLRYVKLRDSHDEPVYWYDFGEDGICNGVYQHTGLFYIGENTYYTIEGRACNGLYLAEDGYYYYFGSVDYTAVKNERHWVSYPNDTGIEPAFYSFDKDGHMIIDVDPSKGGIVEENGELYYYVNGVKTYAGLIQIDGDYYYVNSSCKVVTNQRYWISKTNDLLPAGFYNFGADGKMTDAPIVTPEPEPEPGEKNGIVEENGELYYYVNGVKTYAGLIQIDGDYYYVNSSCKVVTNQRYWISKTNDLLPAGFYNFGADGKMTDAPIVTPEPEPEPGEKNGIVEENGELYYYVNGVKTYAGLIQIDGDYYYVNSSCKVVTNQRYWISKTNDLLPATFYNFGPDGKMVK